MPSLDDILKKNATKAKLVPSRVSIATEDRPYSIAEDESFQPIFDSESTETQNIFNPNGLGNNGTVTQARLQSTLKQLNSIAEKEPIKNREQSGNKPGTKWEQTGNKPETKSQQTVDKTGLKKENWEQSGNQSGNTTGNKVGTNREQSGNKPGTKTTFSELVGLQRNIIILVCHECKNSRSRTTEALTLEYLSVALKCSTDVVKTTIKRLEKKGCLLRVEFKNGRGGWSKYELPDNVYHDVIRSETGNKLETNREQSGNKVGTKPGTEPGTNLSSSSSILNIKETTTELDDEWNFDINSYGKFGFTYSQVKQLAKLGVISASDVEQSLIEFSYDLDSNELPQIKTSKLNFLMGLLRAGQSYVSEGYRNEQEAIISEMARRAEDKRKRLIEDKFVTWEAGLNAEERKKIENKIPLNLRVLFHVHGLSNLEVRSWLFNHYLQSEAEANQ